MRAETLLTRAQARIAELEAAAAQTPPQALAKLAELQEEVERLQAKEAKDQTMLTEYMDKIEAKLAAANARASAARARVRVLEARLKASRAHDADIKLTAEFASTQLVKIAEFGEKGIKQLLESLGDLRLAASTLTNLDRIASLPRDEPDSDSDSDSS